MELILFVLGVGNLVLLFLLYQQRTADNKQVRDLLEDQEDHLSDQLDYRFERERQAQQITGQQIEMAISDRLMELRTEMHQQTTALRAELAENFTKNRDKTDERMQQIQASNDLRLEQMRQTVEEKLEKPCIVVSKPPLRRSPNNWSRSIKVLGKCRRSLEMWEVSIRSSPIPKPVGLWENSNSVRSSNIS